jgi:hypothetical protein
MAYDRTEILAQAKQAIEENELTTIAEVLTYIPCDEATIYSTPEWKIEVLEPIKKALEIKKTSLKAKMKKEWRKEGSNPTLQIAAFKLIADEDEMARLSTSINKNEHTGKDGKELFPEKSDEQVRKEIDEYIKKYGK